MILAKMFISFLISNWLYAEICYFFPSFDAHAKRAYHSVQLPTHEKWDGIASSSGGRRLGHELYSEVKDSGLASMWPINSLLDPKLAHVWQTGSMRGIMSLFSSAATDTAEENLPYLVGDRFFAREGWHPMELYAGRRISGTDFVEVDSVESMRVFIRQPHRGV